MIRTFLAAVLVHLALAFPLLASGWTVERASAAKYSQNGKTWTAVRAGMEIPNASWVQTGPRGRVLITRGSERILFNPNTLAAIATWQSQGLQTKVTQRQGSVLVDVETRRRKHTTVVTPHLAAVVKGTMFEVTVGRAGSSVRVERGLVEVRNEGSGQTVDVPAGKSAKVARGDIGAPLVAESKRSTSNNGRFGEIDPSNSGGNGNGNSGGNGNGNSGGNGNGSSGAGDDDDDDDDDEDDDD